MKKNAFPFLILFFASACFAQIAPKKPVASEYSWRLLQHAEVLYDSGNYTEAMTYALKAKENRQGESRWESFTLDNSLSPFEVRRAGEQFENVMPVLLERQQSESIKIVNKYLDLYSPERFNNSIYNLKSWIEKKSVYPEADYLIGKIYQVEGEYKSAYTFYENARKNSDFLDIPDEIFTILYSMAELAKLENDSETYEQTLLLILSKDSNFSDNVLKNAVIKIIDANKKTNVDRFFSLFRADSPLTMKALHEISEIYESRNEKKTSLFCSALGSLEGFTHIYNSLKDREPAYEFSTLADFLKEISSFSDIEEWCVESSFWDFLIELGGKSSERGNLIFANELLNILAANIPNGYYRSAAANKISR